MIEILSDSFLDTARLVPLLALIYFAVSFIEYRYGSRMGDFIARLGALGPIAGAMFGCIPQCGFSVVASALYARRIISPGTLLSVFISTSDEALPVFLSIPGEGRMVVSLIAIKVIIAITAGIVVDLAATRGRPLSGACAGPERHDYRCGCCSHGVSGDRPISETLFIHPLLHTMKIFIFLFVLATVFNLAMETIGEERVGYILMRGSIFQPVLTAFIGLIPSCFTSVLLAGLFIKGVITFGSLVAGLCAGCGLGLLVLIKENKDRLDTLRVIGLLLGLSIIAGLILSAFRIQLI